jgi:ATP-binding cassette subfamily B multidrug efflux pump
MLKLIGRHLKGAAWAFALLAPLAMVLEVAMDLVQPTLMAHIIDQGVAHHDASVLWTTGFQMVAAALVGCVGGSLCSLFAARAAVSMGARLREGLFAKILALGAPDRDTLTTGSLVTRSTNDVLQVQNMLMMLLRGMVRIPLLLVGSVAMALVLSPSLSTIFLVVLPVVVASIVIVMVRSSPLFTRVQESLDRVNGLAREGLLGLRVTKAFGLEESQTRRFNAENDALTVDTVRAQAVNYSLLPVVTLVMNLCVVAVLWLGGNLVVAGHLEVGKIMAFINYLLQISGSVMMGVGLITTLTRAQVSARRLEAVFDTVPALKVAPAPYSGAAPGTGAAPETQSAALAVEFRNVTFAYPLSPEPALEGLNFTVAPGQHLGVIGATGAGKSTLAALVPRLYDATAGQVLVGGVDVREWEPAALRRRVGLVTQQTTLFQGTIDSNLKFGRPDAPEDVLTTALATAQAQDFVAHRPAGRQAAVEPRGKNFSGGQKQRLSLARALAVEPDVLVLDDSSSALDLKTEAQLEAALNRLPRRQTRITIAQRVSSVLRCDAILVLDQGRPAALGSHEQLMKTSPLYRSIVVSQWGEEAAGV